MERAERNRRPAAKHYQAVATVGSDTTHRMSAPHRRYVSFGSRWTCGPHRIQRVVLRTVAGSAAVAWLAAAARAGAGAVDEAGDLPAVFVERQPPRLCQ